MQSLAYLNQSGQFGDLDDSDDEGEGNFVINVRTALLDAKKGAITAISEIAAHCGEAFLPYMDETLSILQTTCGSYHSFIKGEAAEALANLVTPVVAAKHGGSIDWEKGNIEGVSPLGPETTAVANAVLKILVSLMNDIYQDNVSKACNGIENVLNLCGPHALALVAEECLENTLNLLSRSAPSQLDDADEYEDDEHDACMTSVCDLVATFGRVMGKHFCQYLEQFLPAICEYAKTSRPASDRAMAIGCLGELAQELDDGIKDYWKTIFLPAIIVGLSDDDHNVNRNAAFCAGTCCEGLGALAVSDYLQILQLLGKLFNIDPSISESSAAAVDNACASVCRMIMTSPADVPMSQVLPVVLKALPLKNDTTENDTVYKCLLGLLKMNNADALAQGTEIKRVFIEAISEESKVEEDMKKELKMVLEALN